MSGYLSLYGILCFSISYSLSDEKNKVCDTLEAYFDYSVKNNHCKSILDVNSPPELIAQSYGYMLESHRVRTDDGYILTTYRVRNMTDNSYGSKVIFFQHGLMLNSRSYMSNGNNSIVFYFTKHGYDVWMGNFRDAEFCSHEAISRNDPKYWDFSFHENALYDLPANFKYIYNMTGKKMTYVGHSMGGTTMMIYGALRGEDAEKYIKNALLLSPAVYIKYPYIPTLIGLIVLNLVRWAGIGVLLSSSRLSFQIQITFCMHSITTLKLCLRTVEFLFGPSKYPVEP
ncbi:lipase 1-like, partial [Sitophilus oryzae]|uniref:Lipase 1-like n=1 Tax=Sitophilus oryzae TaxID=7048 RepID=A0A6J2YJN4_SITOR